MSKPQFPALEGWQATKETLHAYSRVVGAVPRAHAIFHPKWWHISLKVTPIGLVTDNIPLPDGGIFNLVMDLSHHRVLLTTSTGISAEFSMQAGLTANQLADQLLGRVAELGLQGDYNREKFANDDPRSYDPQQAQTYFNSLVLVDQTFKRHQASLSGKVGPVQLWPHGFDLAFEWFGTRVETYEEHGEVSEYPSQLNLGFSPGESSHPEPYFYSNPFPFEKKELLAHELPPPARWFTESWQGSLLEYEALVGDPQGPQKLLAYARAVYEISSPTLMD